MRGYEERSGLPTYAAAAAFSIAVHFGLFFMPTERGKSGPWVAAAAGPTAVELTFSRPAPPKAEQAPEKPEYARPRVPEAPTIERVEPAPANISLADIIPAPKPVPPAPAQGPAPDDLPPRLSPPQATQGTAPLSAGSTQAGVTAPMIAPDNGKPEYPRSCLMGMHRADRSACEGTGRWLVKVDKEGRAVEITMLDSAGCQHLDQSARRWLAKARFLPGMENGRPVESTKEFEIRFLVKEYYSDGR